MNGLWIDGAADRIDEVAADLERRALEMRTLAVRLRGQRAADPAPAAGTDPVCRVELRDTPTGAWRKSRVWSDLYPKAVAEKLVARLNAQAAPGTASFRATDARA